MIYAVIYSNPASNMNQAKAKCKGQHTPTKENNGHAINLVILNDASEISEYEGIGVQVLAYGDNQLDAWQEVLDTPSKKNKLDLAYPRPVIDYTDEHGNPRQYQEPPIPGIIYG